MYPHLETDTPPLGAPVYWAAWLAEGASVVHVQHAVGHANIATTMKYTHLADDHVDALLEHETTRGKSGARRPAANA